MSIGSQQQSQQFTIGVFQPLPVGGAHLENLSVSAQQYSHTISAFGGFDTASFRLVDTLPVLQDWYEDGLGRVIQSYDDALQPMWEGFINQVTIRQAGLELTRGPLVNVANRLFAIYSSIDTSTTPPTPGIRKTTGTVNHAESQARYGIWPKILSVAGVTDPNAEQLRDTHLAEYAKPETRSSFAPSGEEITLNVECLGFVHALSYPYNQASNSGTTNLSSKLQAILAADPNSWISSDMSRIATNALAVGQWENDNHLALGLVKGLTALGDANDNRHLFGIYEERQAVYGPAPTDWEYEIRLSDPRQAIFNRTGGEVPAWAVRPGKWIFFSDFLPGRIADSTDLRDDPRMMFVESLDFRLPMGLHLVGGKVDQISQKLARFGLAGLSA